MPTSKEQRFENEFQNFRIIKADKYLTKSQDAYQQGNEKEGMRYSDLAEAFGKLERTTFAAIQGYDAVYAPLGEYIILNRGKCIYTKKPD